MPVFSTGGMRYQDGWKDKPLDEVEQAKQENLNATIRRSLEVGIHHIETARGYGTSERMLGVILPTFDRDKLIIQTKIAPNEDPKVFREQFEESLERMRLDHVDLLGLHGINDQQTLDWSVRPGGCLEVARQLQREGKVNHVGFSTHGTRDIILKAIETDATGNSDITGFDYVNLHWYFIMSQNRPCIEAATRRDMGVFLISPTDKGGHLHTPGDKLLEMCDPLHPIVFNDLFCLSHGQVHTLSLGASKPGDYDLHVEAAERFERGEAEKWIKQIAPRWRDAMRASTGHEDPGHGLWGLPDHRTVPGGLNLPIILWLRNLTLGWGLTAYARSRFNLMGNAGHWFPGAKVTEAFEQVDKDKLAAAASVNGWDGRDVIDKVAEAIELLGGEEVERESAG